MSHISTIELQVKSIDALREACKRLGLEFIQDQKEFRWYSGMSPCSHIIRIPGALYEIGVIKGVDDYYMCWDRFNAGGLTQKIGENAGLLKQAYAIAQVQAEAKRKNYRVVETRQKEGVRLILTK